MEQVIIAAVMLLITTATVLLLLFPTRFKFGTDLVKFYWRGVWYFLAAISMVAGSGEVFEILGYSVEQYIIAALSGLMTAYILFVVFAWFRLVGVGLFVGLRKLRST